MAAKDMGDEWDLAEVVSERDQPTDTVEIYLNELASYAKAQLTKVLNRSKKPEEIKLLTEQIEGIEKELLAKKYTIHITAIPSRMREDIASKAMHEFPIQSNWTGRDDAENQINRTIYENDLIWNAQITKVINPAGQSKSTWTLEETKTFKNAVPMGARNSVTEAINQLNLDADEYTSKSKSIDF